MPSRTIFKLENDVFVAIAHPIRRQILEALAQEKLTTNEIAEPFDVSRSAISQHLTLLVDTGLVSREKQGRKQVYRIKPDNLNEIYKWMQKFDGIWNASLDRLGNLLGELAEETKPDET